MLKSQLGFFRGLPALLLDQLRFVLTLNLDVAEELDDLVLEIGQQGLEQLEGFALVFLLGFFCA
jgi:hypothetical protein